MEPSVIYQEVESKDEYGQRRIDLAFDLLFEEVTKSNPQIQIDIYRQLGVLYEHGISN